DVEQIGQRGVAPDPAIEPGRQKDDGGDRGEGGAVKQGQVRLVLQHVVAEPQIEREAEGQRRHRDIVQEGQKGAAGLRDDRHAREKTLRIFGGRASYSKKSDARETAPSTAPVARRNGRRPTAKSRDVMRTRICGFGLTW